MLKYNEKNMIRLVIQRHGLAAIAIACGVSYQAVQKWVVTGLPRTDFSGETKHAKNISLITDGYFTESKLLAWSKQLRAEKANSGQSRTRSSGPCNN